MAALALRIGLGGLIHRGRRENTARMRRTCWSRGTPDSVIPSCPLGDRFSIGDIPLGCGVWRWFAMDIERPETPNLKRWFDRLSERPAFAKIVLHPLT